MLKSHKSSKTNTRSERKWIITDFRETSGKTTLMAHLKNGRPDQRNWKPELPE